MSTYTEQKEVSQRAWPLERRTIVPWAVLAGMICALLLLDAILPLQGLWFTDAVLTQLGRWPLYPTRILFPGWAVAPALPGYIPRSPTPGLSWAEFPLLLTAFLALFLVYLAALRWLPRHIGHRFVLYSTAVLGFICLFFPVVTSNDIFSYIAYARYGIHYHLNPLTTTPNEFPRDPVFIHLYWTHQPSAYGPTWTLISCALQVFVLIFGVQSVLPMVFALRIFGLAMHLASTLLIWTISGRLQHITGRISPGRRILATLAFAWNPLLIFEAAVNAHNDVTLIFFILLAIWFLLPRQLDTVPPGQPSSLAAPRAARSWLGAVALLAVGTCLKINIAVLFPGLLLFIWFQQRQRVRSVIIAAVVYFGIIVLLYAPFWQGGAILKVLRVNPATYRAINSLPEFVTFLFNSIAADFGHPITPFIGSPTESVIRLLSMGIFVVIYILLFWRAVRTWQSATARNESLLARLICWMTLVWLFYCAAGTPWFWPWYAVTFFGLFALLEATGPEESDAQSRTAIIFKHPLLIRIFAFTLLTSYCLFIWGADVTTIPGLPHFSWSFLRGPWIWLPPLLAVPFVLNRAIAQRYHVFRKEPSE